MRPYILKRKDDDIAIINITEEGFITDMIIETGNDNYDGYREIATQRDFDNF